MYRFIVKFLCLLFMPLFLAKAESLNFGVRDMSQKSLHEEALTLVQKASQWIGSEVNFQYYPSKRSLKLASMGVLDGEMLRHTEIESFYPTLIRVDEPIDKFDYWVWVAEDQECMPDQESLAQLKPIGMQGVKFNARLVYSHSLVGYEEVNHCEQMFNLLARGRADYTVQSKQFMKIVTCASKFKLKTCFDEPLFSVPFYLYLHESKSYLVSDFELAIRAIKADRALISDGLE